MMCWLIVIGLILAGLKDDYSHSFISVVFFADIEDANDAVASANSKHLTIIAEVH